MYSINGHSKIIIYSLRINTGVGCEFGVEGGGLGWVGGELGEVGGELDGVDLGLGVELGGM